MKIYATGSCIYGGITWLTEGSCYEAIDKAYDKDTGVVVYQIESDDSGRCDWYGGFWFDLVRANRNEKLTELIE